MTAPWDILRYLSEVGSCDIVEFSASEIDNLVILRKLGLVKIDGPGDVWETVSITYAGHLYVECGDIDRALEKGML